MSQYGIHKVDLYKWYLFVGKEMYYCVTRFLKLTSISVLDIKFKDDLCFPC